jgi:hypothetical protein
MPPSSCQLELDVCHWEVGTCQLELEVCQLKLECASWKLKVAKDATFDLWSDALPVDVQMCWEQNP